MGVERRQELFRRHAQRQKLDVRGLGLGHGKDSLFSTNEMLAKCWRLWTEGHEGMIKTGDLKNRGKIGGKQWEDLKKQFAKGLGFSNIKKIGWN